MIGKSISHYKIVDKLGEGGMGVVYKAEDTKLARTVALKFLPRQAMGGEDEEKRFVREAQVAAALDHNNICTIYEIDQADGQTFIAMAYIDGQTVAEMLRDRPLRLDQALDLAMQVADGLREAHEKGIVHRDIKSPNIMVNAKGQAKIMDFGLARKAGKSQLTKVGTSIGTVDYMSPQQAQGITVDHQSDIWSLGVVLYEMVTGMLPFRAAYDGAIIYSILHEAPEPITGLRTGVPLELERILNKAMAKEVTERYQNVNDMLIDLRLLAKENESGATEVRLTGSQAKGSAASRSVPTERRFRAGSWARRLGVLTAGLMIVTGLLWLGQTDRWSDLKRWAGFDSVPDQQHVLVLPLTNVGGDEVKQAFCDGLMETLTSKLTQLEQFHGSLWVVPASEVRRYKITSPGEARQTFGANLAITGSLQLLESTLRLTLNLVDANLLRQISSAVIDVGAADVTALQNRSVIELLKMLNIELHPEAPGLLVAGGTTVPGAYEFYLQARGYLQRYESPENLEAAINLFMKAIDQDSVYALAHTGLGEAYWRKYESLKDASWVDKAIQQCEQARKLNPELAPVNVTLGLVHAGTGRYEEAIADFERALDADPANADAYRGLAQAQEAQGMLTEAELTHKKAIQLKSDYWAGYNGLGIFYYRQSRYEEAISQFLQVTLLTPDNYRGFNNIGGIYYFLEKWAEAREMFEKSFAIKKSSSVASNLGTLYYIEGRYGEAARMYEAALKLNDHNYIVWGNLASAYHWTPGKRSKAREKYQQAITLAERRHEVNPRDPHILANLANYHAMIDESAKAKNLIEEALEMGPIDERLMYLAGTTYEQLGNRKQALYWIGQALENGYSRAEVEHQPELRSLLSDPLFQQL